MTIAVLALAAACGSADGPAGDRTRDQRLVGDQGLDVCGLVSDETVDALQTSLEITTEPVQVLMPGAELFAGCQVVSGVTIGFGVRAAPGGPSLEQLVEGGGGAPAEPLDGVGDEALVGSNTYDGVRIVARVGEQELIVDSNAYDGDSGGVSRDDVIALAAEVADGLGSEKPGATLLPSACPAPTAAEVTAAVGTVVLARGFATRDGSVSCSYVSDDRKATLSGVNGSPGASVMAQADSDEGDRLEVEGDPALYDDDHGVVVFVGDSCALTASASPLGWAPADPRSESEQRDQAVELVTFVKESIGCPE